MVFAGDSLIRKLYYEFTQAVITTSTSSVAFKSKKDKTILRVEDMNLSTQFIWAPYAKRRNKDLGGDSRTVFPYEAILGELFSPEPPMTSSVAPAASSGRSDDTAAARLQGRTEDVGAGAEAQASVGTGTGAVAGAGLADTVVDAVGVAADAAGVLGAGEDLVRRCRLTQSG